MVSTGPGTDTQHHISYKYFSFQVQVAVLIVPHNSTAIFLVTVTDVLVEYIDQFVSDTTYMGTCSANVRSFGVEWVNREVEFIEKVTNIHNLNYVYKRNVY